jgi:hypothetical protein
VRFAALAFAAVFALGACSSDDEQDERLSRADYLRQADAICATYDKRLGTLGKAASVEELARNADQALAIAEEGVSKLRELQPPAELEPRVDEWLERNDENVEKIEELRDAAREGDEVAVQAIAADAADNEREADRLARRLGLRSCARAD